MISILQNGSTKVMIRVNYKYLLIHSLPSIKKKSDAKWYEGFNARSCTTCYTTSNLLYC